MRARACVHVQFHVGKCALTYIACVFAILRAYLTEVILSQIHDLLWSTRTLDREGGHCEDSIATLEILNKIKCFCYIF